MKGIRDSGKHTSICFEKTEPILYVVKRQFFQKKLIFYIEENSTQQGFEQKLFDMRIELTLEKYENSRDIFFFLAYQDF